MNVKTLLGCSLVTLPLMVNAKKESPNVIVIYIDDMGIGDVKI